MGGKTTTKKTNTIKQRQTSEINDNERKNFYIFLTFLFLGGTERAETHDKLCNQFIQLLSYGKTRLSPLSPDRAFSLLSFLIFLSEPRRDWR